MQGAPSQNANPPHPGPGGRVIVVVLERAAAVRAKLQAGRPDSVGLCSQGQLHDSGHEAVQCGPGGVSGQPPRVHDDSAANRGSTNPGQRRPGREHTRHLATVRQDLPHVWDGREPQVVPHRRGPGADVCQAARQRLPRQAG